MDKLKLGNSWFVYLLTLIFVLAKIFGKLDWSWWWVFSPIWLYSLFIILVLIVIFIVIMVNKW